MRSSLLLALLLPAVAIPLYAVPTAVNDTFTTPEDTALSGGAVTNPLLVTDFEAGSAGFTLPGSWDYLDTLLTTAAGGANAYPRDGSSRAWNALGFDKASSTVAGWKAAALPIQGGGVDAFTNAPNLLGGITGNSGVNTVNTYLFRTSFTMTGAEAAQTWNARVLADDGCIIYVNGVEAGRYNYPTDVPVNPDALVGGNGGSETAYTTVPLTVPFVAGENVIAVELHQNTNNSSDAGIDLTIAAASADPLRGLVYADDIDGTNRPNVVSGALDSGAGNPGSSVNVSFTRGFGGGGSGGSISGGWRRTIEVPAAATLTIKCDARARAVNGLEDNEFAEAFVMLDGVRLSSGGRNYLVRQVGANPAGAAGGGGNADSGWGTYTIEVPVTAGSHVVAFGGFGPRPSGENFDFDEGGIVNFDNIDVSVKGTGGSLLDNDTGGVAPVTAVKVTDPANGTLVLGSTGTFTYTPNANWFGTDSFSYRAVDSTGQSNPATVTVTVTPVNDAPVGVADSYGMTQGAVLTVPVAQGVLVNDNDVDHAAGALSAVSASTPSNGSVVMNANGSFSYTPTAQFSGAATFTYRVSDGALQSAPVTVTINVADTPDAPVAAGDSYTAVRNTPLVVSALAGGTTTEELMPYKAPDWRYFDSLVLASRNLGTAWRAEDFVENGDWKTGAGELGYGDGDEGTVINDNPDPAFNAAAGDKFAAYYFRRPLTVVNAFNITGVEVSVIYDDAAAFYINGGAGIRTSNLPSLAEMPELAWDYFPSTNVNDNSTQTFTLPAGTFREGINLLAAEAHQNGASSSDLSFDMRVRVTRAISAGVLANDTDSDPGETATLVAELVTGPTSGNVVLNGNGTFTYTPSAGFTGADSFTYRARDTSGRVSAVATASITVVTGPNAAPLVTADSYTTAEDTVLTVTAPGVLANDVDGEGDVFTASVVTQPARGTVVMNANGGFVYTPAADFNGTDTFTYRATDTQPSAPATVTVTVTPVNDAPVARADSYAGDPGVPLMIGASQGVLANDTDADGGTVLTAKLGTPPVGGTVTLNADGSFTFSAPVGGVYTFTYRARDEALSSSPVTVTVSLNAAPTVVAETYSVDEDGTLTVPAAQGVLANDVDPEGQAMTAVLVTGATRGSLTLNADGSFGYTPAANFSGSDSFSYRASDGVRQSGVVVVGLTVNAVNDAPLAVADAYGVRIDTPLTIAAGNGVLRNDTDVEGGSLTAVLVAAPEQGALTLRSDGSFDYVPPTGYSGTTTFSYRASDGSLTSGVTVVTLNVTADLNTVMISEIMYNPPGASGVFEEFIEVYNFGDAAVDLTGWEFSKGVNYVFPAGQLLPAKTSLAVPADSAAFTAKYGGGVAVTATGWGPLSRLSNSGELIRLKNALGETVDEVEYADSGDWAVRKIVGVWDATNTPGQTPANGLDTDPGLEWVTAADPDLEIGNAGGSSIQLINVGLSNKAGANWAAAVPTPGAANAAVARVNSAPLIRDVVHSPAVPNRTQQVTVTARITDELTTGISASVFFRSWLPSGTTPAVDWDEVLLRDDGRNGDGAANDGVYGAVLPAQALNTVVEFYVRAADSVPNVRSWPPPTLDLNGANPVQNANCLYQVSEEAWADARSLYQVVMTGADNAAWNAGLANRTSNAAPNCTVIFRQGGAFDVRYRGSIRTRGNSSRSDTPVNLRLDVPGDASWNGRTAFTLNYKYSYSQFLGSRLMEAAGVPSEKSNLVGMRINGVNRLLDQNGNRTFGYYCDLIPRGGETIDEWFPGNNDGNGYGKIRGNVRWGVSTLPVIGANGWAEGGYVNEGWNKQTNSVQNDWADLHAWITSMNAGTAETFHETIKSTVDIDEWCRFLAMSTIINHAETNMANGDDDDYSVYFGIDDDLCRLIPHDLDTCFNLNAIGLGDEVAPPTGTIYQCTQANYPLDNATLPQMDKFYRNPVTGRKFKAALRRYLDTLFAKPVFDAYIDTMLDAQWMGTQFTPSGDEIRTHIKAFMDTRRATIEAFLPTAFTAATSLPVQNGVPRTTTATNLGDLGGKIDPARTAEVRVNGIKVTTNPYGSTAAADNSWSAGAAVVLQPGMNNLVCTAHDEAGSVIASQTVAIWYDLAGVNRSGTLAGSETWTPGAGPYNVTANLTVPNGAVLTIQPGTTVFVASGASINVNAGGRIVAEGTPSAGIVVARIPSGTGTWGGIRVSGASAAPSLFRNLTISQNGSTAIWAQNGASVEIERVTFLNPGVQFLSFDGSSFRVSDCVFPDSTAGFEPVHGSGGIAAGGRGIIERCRFGKTQGYNDSIDFTGGNRPGPILHVLNCVFTGSDDDILDLDSTDAWIEGNVFMHAHRNGASPDSSSAVSGGSDNADYSQVTVINNLIYDCDNAITMKQGGQPQGGSGVLLYNTIVRTTKVGGIDGGSGIVNFDDEGVAGEGKGFYLEGNVIFDAENLVRNYVPANSRLVMNGNFLPVAPPAGVEATGNVIGADLKLNLGLITNPATATAEQVMAALRPQWCSPVLGAGPMGGNAGADVAKTGIRVQTPPGNVWPATFTIAAGVGGSFTPTGQPAWAYGFTSYKYRVDGGAESPEIAVSVPATLSGLSAGAHVLTVLGKRDSGLWQEVPTTVAFTVVAGIPTVVLSEVLAEPVGGVDFIELRNWGSDTAVLDGCALSDDEALPARFTFPAGTVIAPGGYLVVDATQAGFGLDGGGETVRFRSAGGALIDEVAFGPQLSGKSVARVAGGWRLSEPTSGAANTAVCETGTGSGIRINEWLGSNSIIVAGDFVELYNPEALPVDIGGWRMSQDYRNEPAQSVFPPLSFVGARGFLALVADGDAAAGGNHLAFKISRIRDTIALLDAGAVPVDIVTVLAGNRDVSQGRTTDGGLTIGYLPLPTAGFSNASDVSADVTVMNGLRITELMFDPPSSSQAEYMEFRNITAVPMTLTGVRFASGITFTFPVLTVPANGYAVITQDLVKFAAQFPGVSAVQWAGGRLDNNGESLRVETGVYGLGILDFRYEGNWYPATRAGASLEMVNPLAAREAWNLKASWQPCVPSPGGPSAFGVVTPPDTAVGVGEVFMIDAVVCPGPHPAAGVTVAWSTVSGPAAAVFTAPGNGRTNVTFPMAGVYEIRLLATGPGGVQASDATVVTVSETYAQWAARVMPGLGAADRETTSDPDKDGFSNLVEFALGGNPVRSDAGSLVTVVPGSLPLTMTWRRNPYASPAPVIVPEVSSDLQTWASGPGAVDSLLVTSGGGLETWQSVDAGPAGSPQRYLRLKVIQP
jgi:VCBS repeat-containing protein